MKLAFISGGSRGLGREVAKALKAAGMRVVTISKDESRATATATEFGFEYEIADLQDQSAARAIAEKMLTKYGTPQVVVLAHGVMSEKMA
ncbi:MAG: SDR family NAD(P)-dependent oxidoreductase, partial [Actinomycetales bacterium]